MSPPIMASVSRTQATYVVRQETRLGSSEGKSSWMPGFWPFSSSSAAKPGILIGRASPPAAAGGGILQSIQSLLVRNISSKPVLRDRLRDMQTIIDQHQAPLEVANPAEWKTMTDERLEKAIRVISLSKTLEWMHPKLAENDPTTAAQIIKEAAASNRSLCSIYLEKMGNDLSFFDVLTVKLVHFFLYETGVVQSIIESSGNAILEKIRSIIAQKDDGKNLTALMSSVLKRLDIFLFDYLEAVKEYGKGAGKPTDTKEEYVKKRLEKELGEICQEFSDVLVNEFLPDHFSFFQQWKESPYLIVRLLAKIFTYFPEIWLTSLLHAQLRKQLPDTLEALINDQTSKEDLRRNLTFSIKITESLNAQLESFRKQLGSDISTASQGPTPGTEQLPDVITKLLEVLRLERYSKREEIEAHLNEDSTFLSRKIKEGLQTNFVDGCRILFSYLSDPNHSEEIFSRLLSFTILPYTTSSTEDLKTLNEQYEQKKKEMRREADEIFKNISRQSIKQYFHGLSEEDLESLAKTYCSTERDRWTKMSNQLQNLITGMQRKVLEIPMSSGSTPLPAPDKSILEDINDFFTILSSYRSSILSNLDELANLPSSFELGISKTLEPLTLYLNSLLEQARTAEFLQKQLVQVSTTASALQKLEDALFHQTTENLQEYSKLWPVYESVLEELRSVSGNEAKIAEAAWQMQNLREIHQQLEAETIIVRELYSLAQDEGLLRKLVMAVDDNLREPSFFSSVRKLRTQIAIVCGQLPEKKREEILALVDAMRNAQSISQLQEQWEIVRSKMPVMYSLHVTQKTSLSNGLKAALQNARDWTHSELQMADEEAKTAKEDLSALLDLMGKENLVNLQGGIRNIQPNREEGYFDQVKRIGKSNLRIAGGALGGAIGGLGAYFEVPGALILASGIAGVISYMTSNDSTQPTSTKDLSDAPEKEVNAVQNQVLWSAGLRAMAGGTIAAAAGALIPYARIATPVILAHAGWNAPQAATAGFSDKLIYPEVKRVFDSLYKFILQPHVWNRLVVDGIVAVNAAHRTA